VSCKKPQSRRRRLRKPRTGPEKVTFKQQKKNAQRFETKWKKLIIKIHFLTFFCDCTHIYFYFFASLEHFFIVSVCVQISVIKTIKKTYCPGIAITTIIAAEKIKLRELFPKKKRNIIRRRLVSELVNRFFGVSCQVLK
jgi:hypothetical protein